MSAPRLFFILGSVFLVLACIPGYRLHHATSQDHFWTHRDRPLPLTAAEERVEVLIKGRPLSQWLREGALKLSTNGQESTLTRADFASRVDLKNTQIQSALGPTVFLAALGIAFWAFSLTQVAFAWQRKKTQALKNRR